MWLIAVVVLAGCSKKPAGTELGVQGGVVELIGKGSQVSLRVPTGAISREVAFTLREIPRPPGAAGPAIEAGPHGATFEKPVTLRFAPRPDQLARGVSFTELRVATLVAGRWEFLPTSFPAPGVIEGQTTHFSTFALVAPCQVSSTGTDFPLTGCPLFDPHITTSAPVRLNVSAGKVSVKMLFAPTAPGPQRVTVNVAGLKPNFTYFLRRDAESTSTPVVSDATGGLQFSQDTGERHLVLLMERRVEAISGKRGGSIAFRMIDFARKRGGVGTRSEDC